MKKLQKGTKLQHYKGGKYKVLGFATHSETLESLVIYQNIENHRIWARPINMFSEEVYKDGEKVPRFQIIDEEE